jgi:proteasome assembly chaperone 2
MLTIVQCQPVVSVANVAQLSIDILIATLDLKRIGIFDPRYLHPIVGAREDNEAGVITPLERKPVLDNMFIIYLSAY